MSDTGSGKTGLGLNLHCAMASQPWQPEPEGASGLISLSQDTGLIEVTVRCEEAGGGPELSTDGREQKGSLHCLPCLSPGRPALRPQHVLLTLNLGQTLWPLPPILKSFSFIQQIPVIYYVQLLLQALGSSSDQKVQRPPHI